MYIYIYVHIYTRTFSTELILMCEQANDMRTRMHAYCMLAHQCFNAFLCSPWIYLHIHSYTWLHAISVYIRKSRYIHVCQYIHAYTHTQTHMHIYTYICNAKTCMHAYYIHLYILNIQHTRTQPANILLDQDYEVKGKHQASGG
jgi:hypothetical protein